MQTIKAATRRAIVAKLHHRTVTLESGVVIHSVNRKGGMAIVMRAR